ncbi:hypothetical protein D3C81_1602380 [compost metagenome]
MLACQVRQRAGFGEGHRGGVAGIGHGLGENVAAKGARRQEHHLAFLQQRRQFGRQAFVGGRRQRDHQQASAADGFGQVIGQAQGITGLAHGQRARTGVVLGVEAAYLQQLLQRLAVAAPQAHLVALFRQFDSCRVATVTTAQY